MVACRVECGEYVTSEQREKRVEPVTCAEWFGNDLNGPVMPNDVGEFVQQNGAKSLFRPGVGVLWKQNQRAKITPCHRRYSVLFRTRDIDPYRSKNAYFKSK